MNEMCKFILVGRDGCVDVGMGVRINLREITANERKAICCKNWLKIQIGVLKFFDCRLKMLWMSVVVGYHT